jgi:hypothetical protein
MRHRKPRTVELPGQADVQAAVPVFGIHLLDLRGRPGDAGIVDQHVEAAEFCQCLGEQVCDCLAVRDVARRRGDRGIAFRQRGQRRLVDIASVNLGPFAGKTARDRKPDPVAACADQHA